jgi:thiol-disulfide isomerase/thioredoxin
VRILSIALILFSALPALPAGLTPVDEASYPKIVAAHKGKVVLVNFWATWCVPCRAEMPVLAEMEARLKAKGMLLVTVSADEPEQQTQAVQFLAKSGITSPAYLKIAKNDDQFINSIDPKWSGALPALVLYDRTGKKVKMFVGETNLNALEAQIVKLL